MSNFHLEQELKNLKHHECEQVPDFIRKGVDQILASLPEKKDKKPNVSKWMIGSVAAAVVVGGTIGFAAFSPAMAQTLQQIPILGSFFQQIGDDGLENAEKHGFATKINQTKTANGVTIKLTKVIYDGSRIAIGYEQSSDQRLPGIQLHNVQFEINGSSVPYALRQQGSLFNFDSRNHTGVLEIFPDKDLPERFDMKVIVRKVGNIEGNWEFTFPVAKSLSPIKVVTPNQTKTAGNTTVTVKKVSFNASATEINLDVKRPVTAPSIKYEVTDDRGAILPSKGAFGSGETHELEHVKLLFSPVQKLPKMITIRAYEYDNTMKPDKVQLCRNTLPTPEKPITIYQRNIFRIFKIEHLADKTRIHYQVTQLTKDQYGHLFLVEDQQGKDLPFYKNKLPQLTDPKTNTYMAELPAMKPGETFMISSTKKEPFKVIKELEFQVVIQ
ncbi:DUF4179 domain-containing protein [Lihuaxuella thermophila]|uniref:DUF4179 domain-containing protein n=1 Tax=Lihuaxuella thermophila TaxID=1173111 RepID=A0A1H8BP27_9BACL|nr:DUF4179 domain-containing protein [Lihuaxuella thermophila]SEM84595.1 protein of unknown function [Lihuaxuella thermophila]